MSSATTIVENKVKGTKFPIDICIIVAASTGQFVLGVCRSEVREGQVDWTTNRDAALKFENKQLAYDFIRKHEGKGINLKNAKPIKL
jgi:hypothetical protein